MIFGAILLFIINVKISLSHHCNDGSNPCKLDQPDAPNAYFLPKNGYYCLDAFNGQIICTCPDNSSTRDKPCRICDRNPNPCGVGPSVVACNDINQSFTCLCRNQQGDYVVSTKPCENSDIKPPSTNCENEGIHNPSTDRCYCPSGFTGQRCETKLDGQLCERIICMSNGVCGIRPIVPEVNGYQSKCLCPSNSDGEYCERQSRTGSCSSMKCLNGGICQERTIGIVQYVSCICAPGWVGITCQKQYFYCQSEGYFIDDYMKNQGKYFFCARFENDFILRQRSCPKGLKFNVTQELCLY